MHRLTPFRAPRGMANPHLQTILSSLGRKTLLPRREAQFLAQADETVVEIEGVKLAAAIHSRPGAPVIVIIPGWLGTARSSYVISAAKSLWSAGFSVCRVTLRDHGETAGLNEGMFHSAMLDEVVGLVSYIGDTHGNGHTGLLGYSMGGNFALRVAGRLPEIATLAVCPALAPAETVMKIERNPIYQRYFLRKWRRVFAIKQSAFPQRYDFNGLLSLPTISAMTDQFVAQFTEFGDTADYFAAYDLKGNALEGVHARILAAGDDPIIPADHYANLPESIELDVVERGGHGAFLENWQLESWADRYAIAYFSEHLSAELFDKFARA